MSPMLDELVVFFFGFHYSVIVYQIILLVAILNWHKLALTNLKLFIVVQFIHNVFNLVN